MPRKDQFKKAMEQYLEVVKKRRAQNTHKVYEIILARLYRIVKDHQISTYLTRWTMEDYLMLMSTRGHLLPNSYNQESAVMRNLLQFVGNMNIERSFLDGDLKRKPPSRVNVRWFSEEKLAYIRANSKRDVEYLVVILASEIGLRRAEISALLLSDIVGDYLVVRGKGEKMVPVPITISLRETLDAWLLIRQDMIKKALRKRPDSIVPSNVLIWTKGGRIQPYKPESITDIMTRLGKRLGMKISPHDLRRSCGREIYLATGDIVAVNRLLRHANLDQTRSYIGADLEDARKAMEIRESKRALTVPRFREPVKEPRY